MTPEQLAVTVAINSWKLVFERADRLFSSLSDGQLQGPVAPGKNRLIYLLGHLTAINDAMFSILGFGARLHPELDSIFVSTPDGGGTTLPPIKEVKKYWREVNVKLLSDFETLSPVEWLQRHYSISEEEYARDPTRNRLAVLLSRTNHMSYHLGQAVLAPQVNLSEVR